MHVQQKDGEYLVTIKPKIKIFCPGRVFPGLLCRYACHRRMKVRYGLVFHPLRNEYFQFIFLVGMLSGIGSTIMGIELLPW